MKIQRLKASQNFTFYLKGRLLVVTSEEIIKISEEKMVKAVSVTTEEFKGIRTGRASSALLDRINVDYYGTK